MYKYLDVIFVMTSFILIMILMLYMMDIKNLNIYYYYIAINLYCIWYTFMLILFILWRFRLLNG